MFSVERSSPKCLYRAFPNPEHANDFVSLGRVRFADVHSYKSIEDSSRRDVSEGSGELQVPSDSIQTLHIDKQTGECRGSTFAPGHLQFGSTFMNPVYALCMSGPDVDLAGLRTKMGPHVVRISDTARLVADVASALDECPIPDREVLFVDLLPVAYDKGLVGDKPANTTRLSYAQKPPSFVDECEHRLAIGISGGRAGAPGAFFLDLRSAPDYCELMSCV